MRRKYYIVATLFFTISLILVACAAPEAETITSTVTQPAITKTVTTTGAAVTVTETKTVTVSAGGMTTTPSTTTTSTPSTTTTTTPSTTTTTSTLAVITSPDGKLQIADYFVSSLFQATYFCGNIENISSSNASAEVTYEMYDVRGNLLDTIVRTYMDIAPGELRYFEVQFTRGAFDCIISSLRTI